MHVARLPVWVFAARGMQTSHGRRLRKFSDAMENLQVAFLTPPLPKRLHIRGFVLYGSRILKYSVPDCRLSVSVDAELENWYHADSAMRSHEWKGAFCQALDQLSTFHYRKSVIEHDCTAAGPGVQHAQKAFGTRSHSP